MAITEDLIIRATYQGDDLQEKVQAQGKAFDALEEKLADLQKRAKAGGGMEELGVRLDSTLDTIVEFGGSVRDQTRALAEMGRVAAATGQPLALVAKAAEKLADEADDGAAAATHLAQAMQLAERAMLKTEDAGALMGRALKGDTAALRALGPAATQIADAIDKIPDPAERARRTIAAMNQQMTRSPGLVDKARASVARLDVELASLGLGAGTATMALTAFAAVAAGAVVLAAKKATEAWSKYTATLDAGQVRTEQMTRALGQLEAITGRAVHQTGLLDKAYTAASATIEAISVAVSELSDMFSGVAGTIAEVVSGAWAIAQIANPVMVAYRAVVALLGALESTVGVYDRFKRMMGDQSAVAGSQAQHGTGGGEGVDATVARLEKERKRKAPPRAVDRKSDAAFADMLAGGVGGRKGGGGGGGRAAPQVPGMTMANTVRAVSDAIDGNLALFRIAAETAKDLPPPKSPSERQQAMATMGQQLKLLAQQGEVAALEFNRVVVTFDDLVARQNALAFLGEVNNALSQVTTSALDMSIALLDGSLAFSDLGTVAADSIGGILADSGKALAEMAIKSGAVFSAFGVSLEALKTLSGGALIAASAGLIGAGALLKRFFGSGGGGAPSVSGARRADSSAAAEIERLGRRLIDKEGQREGQQMVLQVGDRQMSAYVIDTVNDRAKRMSTPTTAQGGAL